MKYFILLLTATSVLVFGMVVRAEIKIVVERNAGSATAAFTFKGVSSPAKGDAATKATFAIVDGVKDNNGGELAKLHDGRVPRDEDQPSENFFFNAGTDGGRLQIDLAGDLEIKQINTYSWHSNTRGPQVYKLYASGEKEDGFNAQPKRGTEPESCGWRLIAKVDTRPKEGEAGGQHGVSISDSQGIIGKFRYLLFDVSPTENSDSFGNTFYSEIDVIDSTAPQIAEAAAPQTITNTFDAEDGKYQFTLDTSVAPDLTEWAKKELAPVVREWYPRLVRMLPSDGYEAPTNITIRFRDDMRGTPASAGAGRINCNSDWFRRNLKGEARGAVVHEMVHVVQNYGRARRNNPNATRNPGWLTEGIPDYIRWFLYEPEVKGAEITARNLARAKYDASYRITGNFLNWVMGNYDASIVMKLNAAAREGKYSENLWQDYTGKTLAALGDQWKSGHEERLAAQTLNTLTEEQKKAGWKLLFNGKDFTGWHNFRTNTVRAGWQVKDGLLVCADPKNAGDLCTDGKYDWFELELDYNITPAGNSGIMYHVTDEGRAAWATGPEVQLEDNKEARDPQRCGWLYALYQPEIDPKTEKPLDATRPAGQWNRVRLIISPEKCEHYVNGVKYFDYVLDSDDFKARVAKSKFGRMPLFAKSESGYIALQGDHGEVSFRNVKLRPIDAKK